MSEHTTADGSNALSELVIATIPAVLLYYAGWVYLLFYLQAFGIEISELDFDTQTIFIYSVPPFRMFLLSFWHWLLLGIMVLAVIMWLSRKFATQKAKHKLASCLTWFRRGSPLKKGLGIFAGLLLLIALFHPVIRWSATEAANRKWDAQGIRIQAMIKNSIPREESAWEENYKRCSSRQALDLIFSDKESYYMLCISSHDKTSAVVFEVRRDVGLTSVRLIKRGG